MSGGGGKGGSQTTSTQVPDWVRGPAERNLNRAEEISQIGYVPYAGPEYAAFTPQQLAAFDNSNGMAQAYGLNGGAVTAPQAQTFAGGVQGYSSMPLYEQSVSQLAATRPGQFAAINNQFIDPITGASPLAATAATTVAQEADRTAWEASQMGDSEGHGVGNPTGNIGGYSGIGDAFDGGGPGQSGGSFQGGGAISGIGNAFGGPGGGASGGGNK